MIREVPLGRIAGIKVGMKFSVILVAALYTVVFAARISPQAAPDLPTVAYWLAGAGGALLLLASLLVHEIGHGLVALDEGIGVHSMALTPLGGVTRMESSPPTAAAELRVSVVGPLASLACGVALLSVSYLVPDGGLFGLAGRVLGYVGGLNVFLAAFNMVPASPLDGGKVLSALIWLRTGRQGRAMQIASLIGVGTGAGSIIVGFWLVRRHPDASWWPWLIVVGGFILLSAWRELRASPLYVALEGVSVATAMTTGAAAAPAWTSVGAFLRSAEPAPDHQAFPVVGADGHLVGLLTGAAVRAVPPHHWDTLAVGDLAFPLDRLVKVSPTDALLPAMQKVEGADVHSALVVDGEGTVVGTLDTSALHRAMTLQRAGLEPAGQGTATVRP